jgi:hypothetical protein
LFRFTPRAYGPGSVRPESYRGLFKAHE